jgi:hypothetical protein
MRDGAPLTIVRPGLLYGPGRNPPLARRSVAVGPLRVLLARPGYLLPLSYVDNVADAIALAARVDAAAGRAYTIVDAHARQATTRVSPAAAGARWSLYAAGLLRAAASGCAPPVCRPPRADHPAPGRAHAAQRDIHDASSPGRARMGRESRSGKRCAAFAARRRRSPAGGRASASPA